jgi:hypothetical protein
VTKLNWDRQAELAQVRMGHSIADIEARPRTSLHDEAIKGMPRDAQLDVPTCPECNRSMVLRRRKSDNAAFFGCRNYPDCKQTLPYKGR